MSSEKQLDLKARNAQLEVELAQKNHELEIAASLERVRARTMAMQNSEELAETVFVLFQQFKELGENPDQATIGIINEKERVIEYWVTMYGSQVNKVFKFSIDEPNVTNKIYKAWEQKKKSLVINLSGKELHDFAKYRESMGGARFNKDEKRRIINVAFFSKGLLNVQSTEERSEESIRLLERFAAVFEGTYTRFLDLKQAEAQAREAQIELGLERVRAKAMSMHLSQDINGAVLAVFEELEKLDLDILRCGIGIIDKDNQVGEFWTTVKLDGKSTVQVSGKEPMQIHPLLEGAYIAWLGQTDFLYELQGDDLIAYYKAVAAANFTLPESQGIVTETNQASQYYYTSTFKAGNLYAFKEGAFPENAKAIIKRFVSVLNLTFSRFLDLKQAEEQGRESQIQLGLERVRAKAMSMQTSEELNELIGTIFGELTKLDFVLTRCLIMTFDQETKASRWWMANSEAPAQPMNYLVQNHKNPAYDSYLKAWKERDLKWNYTLKGKVKRDWDDFLFVDTELAQLPKPVIEGMKAPEQVLLSASFNNFGCLTLASLEPLSDEHSDIMLRFAKVFDMCYTRFNDLKQAEAQAREAQIEAALERVRSRSMGMQKSDELKEVIQVVFDQFIHLNINIDHTGFVVDYEPGGDWHFWIADHIGSPNKLTVANFDSIWNKDFDNAKKKGIDFFTTYLDFEAKNKFYRDMFEHFPDMPQEYRNNIFSKAGLAASTVLMEDVALYIENFSGTPYTDAENATLMRFGKVFQQTYTRFLDLQRAEAQAREAQIEAALEKVRSRSLAMHKSDELLEVVTIVVEKLYELGFAFDGGVAIATFLEGSRDVLHWLAVAGQVFPKPLFVPYLDSQIASDIWNAKDDGMDFLSKVYNFKEKNAWWNLAFEHSDYKYTPETRKKFILESPSFAYSTTLLKNSSIAVTSFSGQLLTEQQNDILKRLGKVFEQAYVRFLDLQKAEAQAREAQIEAALEKVRSRSLAMHQTDELKEVVSVVFEKLHDLDIVMEEEAASIVIFTEGTKDLILWNAIPEQLYSKSFYIPYYDTPVITTLLEAKNAGADFFERNYVREEKDHFWNWAVKYSDYKNIPDERKNQILESEHFACSVAFTKNSAMLVSSYKGKLLSAKEGEILKRFARVFEQAYVRFLDLHKAETQAREALIETALERVRSRTLAMQKSDELAETAAVLFRQMISLGIEPNRLYIGILRDDTSEIEFWITDEDGSKVSNMFAGDSAKNRSMQKMRDAWKAHEKSIIIDMHGHELTDYFHYLGDILHVPFKGGLTQKRRVQYISYFSNGFIGMASPDEQPQETINLLDRFAYVFNLTYARFNDLKIAEQHAIQAERDLIEIKAARKRAEDALTDLQLAQRQLIQSEKMASLGELTAGIAHEIQNPLNFVNNFSEVSAELIEEMGEELDKGDIEEAMAIASDLKQNLEKIRHHGKRADGIVKGMLQHSRASSNVKEPTDINKLADEYLHLAYHGLRAKDKSFNADLITHLDERLPKANVVPQDIGRAVLNMINNAFYATQQKAKTAGADYKPEVTVSTCKEDGQVMIRVKDNGDGIPEAIKEKIMQPFFTTKPTGEGTGLGLSLSYDIVVKGHGGTIQVSSAEGEGSEFIIQLPLNQST